jgi:DNA-binding response OmpR family regulator
VSKKSDKYILVVEDEADLCSTVTKAISHDGFSAIGVNTIRDASFKLKNQTYSCILIDMRIGEERGEDLIELIRTRKDYNNVATPIIVISGFLDKDVIMEIRGKIQGAIVKPFDAKSLLEMLNKLAS